MAQASLSILPPELLDRIMRNLDTESIMFSFRPICRQFYQISDAYDQYELDLNSMSLTTLKKISRLIQPENIISLELNDKSDNSDRIKIFFTFFETNRFTRLRSITLGAWNNFKDYELLNHLDISNIVSLRIYSNQNYQRNVLHFISKVIMQPTLCKLYLMESGYTITNISWPSSCSIAHLIIHSCSLKEYNFILQRSPYLRSIVITRFIIDQSNEVITRSPVPKQYPQLMSLTIGNSSLSMTDFELLLSLTPSLARLKLLSHKTNLHPIMDGSDWERLIRTKLRGLETFEFFFSYTLRQDDDTKDLRLWIDTFRTPFWLHEKKWVIICDYILKPKVINFYTIPRCAVTLEQKLQSSEIVQFSSVIMRFNTSSADIDSDPTIQLICDTGDVKVPQVCTEILWSKRSLDIVRM